MAPVGGAETQRWYPSRKREEVEITCIKGGKTGKAASLERQIGRLPIRPEQVTVPRLGLLAIPSPLFSAPPTNQPANQPKVPSNLLLPLSFLFFHACCDLVLRVSGMRTAQILCLLGLDMCCYDVCLFACLHRLLFGICCVVELCLSMVRSGFYFLIMLLVWGLHCACMLY